MKTDKELLMLAAMASGLMSKYCSAEFSDRCVYFAPFAETPDFSDPKCASVLSEPVSLVVWSPLTDDGDAFLLAIDLDMDVCLNPRDKEVTAFTSANGDIAYSSEPYGNDKHAATRHAIVRAAAAIGESME